MKLPCVRPIEPMGNKVLSLLDVITKGFLQGELVVGDSEHWHKHTGTVTASGTPARATCGQVVPRDLLRNLSHLLWRP